MFHSPGAIAFTFCNIDIYWYGIIMSCSILFGIIMMFLVSKKFFKEISADILCDLSFVLIISGIIFARLYYVILDYKYFMKYPFEIVAIWNGGISIQGAIIGGIIAGYVFTKENKLNFLRLADLTAFGLIVGQILGRWGNFFNSEAFGLPTNLPWKLYIPYSSRPIEYRSYEYFHPAFLYESLLNVFVLFILLFILFKNKNRKDGIIFFSYIILYSIVRFVVETVRIDSVLSFGYVHVAHIVCIIFILTALISIFYINVVSSDNN